jgi:glycosyltransferase involved in cell wall biosynthesis
MRVHGLNTPRKSPKRVTPAWGDHFHNPLTCDQACRDFNAISDRALENVLKPVRFRGPLKPGEIAVMCVLRNEAARLPLFFEHHRKLGIDRFFMIDNASSDGSAELLLNEPLADVFLAESSFFESHFGLHWYNAIARAYAQGNWVLMADADELFVYDGMASHDINALARRLESQGADRIYAPMIDLYTSGSIGSRKRSVAEIMASDCWFDSAGYHVERYPSGWILVGGPRERLFNTENRNQPHWVSKYPLFRVTDATVLFHNHFLWPWDRQFRGPEAALLHLKILDDFIERCAISEQENEHAFDSNAYRIINRRLEELPELVAIDAQSRRYEGPSSLIENGLLLPIEWDDEASARKSVPRTPHQEWLDTLPPSGLVWNGFEEFNRCSQEALQERFEVVRCRGPLAPGEIAVICVLRNEARRLPSFFDHYRQLGVDRFFMVDNDSDDESRELLIQEPNADVFIARTPFSDACFGLYWSNGIARQYCNGNWVLVSDADELLVYDGMESGDLPALAAWLERHGQDRLFCMMVDVYPSGAIDTRRQRPLAEFLAEDCWFDSEGFSLHGDRGGWIVTGGPRHRVFNRDRAEPYRYWLSKYPFFRMDEKRAYVSNHWIWPMDWRLRRPQGALLHLKLIDDFIERSARYEREAQHDHGAEAYRLINEKMAEMPEVTFFHPNSRRYRGPKSLVRYRVMQAIDWDK